MFEPAALDPNIRAPRLRIAIRNELPIPRPVASANAAPRCDACGQRNNCLPRGLDSASMARMGEHISTRRRVKRGDTLVHAGTKFESLYAVRSGFFKSIVILEDGREQVTGFHMAGEILGFDGIGAETHESDLVALEDSEVCVLPYEQLEDPTMQRQLHRAMSRELARDHGVMALLGTMRAEERLAAFLINLSQRLAARGFSSSDFHLRMTRDEIGSYLGLSLETVSRLFSRFHDEGLVDVHQRHIRILDVARLRATIFAT